MIWKLNYKGEAEYQREDAEKIQEMSPSEVMAFGVKLSSRYGQVREFIAMLQVVHDLHWRDRETLRLIKEIHWDAQHDNMSVELRDKIPWGWGAKEADELGLLMTEHGCPGCIHINKGGKPFRCVENYEAAP